MKRMKINLERWKQSDIIQIIRIYQLADMTFNQINYAMDFACISFFAISSCCLSQPNRRINDRTNNFIFISGYQVM